MRIALVDPASFTPPYDHGLAAALARRGHDVHLLTSVFAYDRPPEPDGYERHELFLPVSTRVTRKLGRTPARVPLKVLEYGPSVVRLMRRIAALEPDVVHLQWLPLPRADVNWVKPLARRRPTLLTAHDVLPRRRGQLGAWTAALMAVARVVVHSPRAVEELVGIGIPRERLARVVHPIMTPRPGVEIRPPSGKTLLFFGLLRGYKGLDVLVAAYERLLRDVPDARLVVAGEALEPTGPVREQARRLGVDDRIDWRLRYVAHAEIPALMAEATVVVLPYRKLDSSGVLATALGHGRPAVVSDVGSLGEIVRDFGAGRVVPPGDAEALAGACAALLSDAGALADAYRGTARARGELTWDAAAAAHERLYEEAVP
jgi:glycosyltransferase involved in cell wall biosynthesis